MPTAEQAALMNAQYRAANNLPVDNINTMILSTRQGQTYTDYMDAANEAAKYQAAFSQPRNDIPVEPSQRFKDITSQYEASRNRVVTPGGVSWQGEVTPSTNPYPEGTAAFIAWNVRKSGGAQNPYLADTATAYYGMDPSTLNVRTESGGVAPLSDIYSGKEKNTAWGRDTVATRDLSSDISRGDYGAYVPSETGKTYYRQGAGQVGIQGATFMNTESGAVTTFSTDLGDRRILNIRGGSSIFGAQSGTISVKPSSSLIYESDFAHYEKGDSRRYSKESKGDFLGVDANPFAYSRPGAEAYGGMGGISLDGRTIKSKAPIKLYGSKDWWGAQIENREKVAKANTAESPLTLAAVGGLGLADDNTFIGKQLGTQRSRYASDSGNLANWVSPSGLDYIKGEDAGRSKQNAIMKDGILTVDKNYGYDTSNVLSGLIRGNDRAGFVSNEAPTKLKRVTTYTPPTQESGRRFGDLSSMMVEVPNPKYGVTKVAEPIVVTKPTVYGAAALDIISAGWGEKNVRAAAVSKKTAGGDLGPGRFVPTATGAGIIMGAGVAEPSAGERGPSGPGFGMPQYASDEAQRMAVEFGKTFLTGVDRLGKGWGAIDTHVRSVLPSPESVGPALGLASAAASPMSIPFAVAKSVRGESLGTDIALMTSPGEQYKQFYDSPLLYGLTAVPVGGVAAKGVSTAKASESIVGSVAKKVPLLPPYGEKYGVVITPGVEKAAEVAKNTRGGGFDSALLRLAQERGFTKPPSLIPLAEYNALDAPEIHRGVTRMAAVNSYLKDSALGGRHGVYGSGTYFADSKKLAERYGDNLITVKLSPNAKIGNYADVTKTMRESGIYESGRGDDIAAVFKDVGRYATALGYDALYSSNSGIYTVLNRGATVVSDTHRTYSAIDIYVKEPAKIISTQLTNAKPSTLFIAAGSAATVGASLYSALNPNHLWGDVKETPTEIPRDTTSATVDNVTAQSVVDGKKMGGMGFGMPQYASDEIQRRSVEFGNTFWGGVALISPEPISQEKWKAYATASKSRPVESTFELYGSGLRGAKDTAYGATAYTTNMLTGLAGISVLPKNTEVIKGKAPEYKTTTTVTRSGGNQTISDMGSWLETTYPKLEADRSKLNLYDTAAVDAFNARVGEYEQKATLYEKMYAQNPIIETTTTTKTPVPGTGTPDKVYEYGGWSRFAEGSGRVARAVTGISEEKLSAYETSIRSKPGLVGDLERIEFGAAKFMLTEPANLAPAAITGAALAYGGAAIGGAVGAVAGGTSRVAPAASWLMSPTGQTVAKAGLASYFGTAYGIGVTETKIGPDLKITHATKEQTEFNIGSTLPGLGAMFSGAGGLNWLGETRTVNLRSSSGSSVRGVSISGENFLYGKDAGTGRSGVFVGSERGSYRFDFGGRSTSGGARGAPTVDSAPRLLPKPTLAETQPWKPTKAEAMEYVKSRYPEQGAIWDRYMTDVQMMHPRKMGAGGKKGSRQLDYPEYAYTPQTKTVGLEKTEIVEIRPEYKIPPMWDTSRWGGGYDVGGMGIGGGGESGGGGGSMAGSTRAGAKAKSVAKPELKTITTVVPTDVTTLIASPISYAKPKSRPRLESLSESMSKSFARSAASATAKSEAETTSRPKSKPVAYDRALYDSSIYTGMETYYAPASAVSAASGGRGISAAGGTTLPASWSDAGSRGISGYKSEVGGIARAAASSRGVAKAETMGRSLSIASPRGLSLSVGRGKSRGGAMSTYAPMSDSVTRYSGKPDKIARVDRVVGELTRPVVAPTSISRPISTPIALSITDISRAVTTGRPTRTKKETPVRGDETPRPVRETGWPVPPAIPGWPNWPGGSGGYSGGLRRGRGANRETIGIRSSLEELFAPVRRRAPTPRRATKPRPKKRKR